MKKIFALLAGISLLSGCVLPASAEDASQKDHFFHIVIGSGKNGTYYLADCSGAYVGDIVVNTEDLKRFGKKTVLQYGDIVQVQGSGPEIFEETGISYMDISNIEIGDSAESYFENTKELTITELPSSSRYLTLEDSEGKSYQYSYYGFDNIWNNTYIDNYHFETPFDAEKFAVGQTWKFVMNGEDVVLPLEMVSADSITVKPVSAVTANGDADGNGTLDILDIITVNKVVLGKENLDPERIPYIDFNQNNVPDSDDALTMLKMIVGLA